MMFSSSDKTVKIWDTMTRQCEHTFKEHTDQVRRCGLYSNLHLITGMECML